MGAFCWGPRAWQGHQPAKGLMPASREAWQGRRPADAGQQGGRSASPEAPGAAGRIPSSYWMV